MRRLALAVLTLLAACVNEGPQSGPGELTATLRSPNGPEGAAVLVLYGEGIGAVSEVGSTEVHAHASTGSVQVVLIDQTGGELAFRVAVADTTQPPTALIQEVAGTDDELRPDLTSYVLELRR